jgi:hypothetical protein
MSCYYPGCSQRGGTKEHIPPKAFFPKDQRDQLLTVTSCERHNNGKSSNDIYVLAHICMNASPLNRSREVWMQSVAPQLNYNGNALRKMLAADAIRLPTGAVQYKVDKARFDRFFTALSYGIVYKACGERLPAEYTTRHIYHNFKAAAESSWEKALNKDILDLYSGAPMAFMDFGSIKALNSAVYSVKIFGIPGFKSSLTIVHDFFGIFRVTSMLTKHTEPPKK